MLTTRRALLLLSLFACSAWAGAAWAHGFMAERSAVAQISPDHLELLLIHAEPPGPRTRLLLTKFDLDRNGRLAPLEQAMIGAELREVAFHGFSLRVDGAPLQIGTPQVKVKIDRERGGGLTAAYYRRVELPALADADPRSVELRLADTATLAIDVAVEADGGLRLRDDDADTDAHTSGARHLAPGQRLQVELTPAAAEK